jgi:hypothetical protein
MKHSDLPLGRAGRGNPSSTAGVQHSQAELTLQTDGRLKDGKDFLAAAGGGRRRQKAGHGIRLGSRVTRIRGLRPVPTAASVPWAVAGPAAAFNTAKGRLVKAPDQGERRAQQTATAARDTG